MTYVEVVENWVRRTRAEADLKERRTRARGRRRILLAAITVCIAFWGAVAWALCS